MATGPATPLDLYRANTAFVIQMLTVTHEARRQLCEIEMQRIRRDLVALNTAHEMATDVRDLSEFVASYQSMLRDYLATTVNIWEQALESAACQQSVYSDGFRSALAGNRHGRESRRSLRASILIQHPGVNIYSGSKNRSTAHWPDRGRWLGR